MSMVNKPKHYIGIKGLEVEEVLQNFIPKYKDGYSAHRAASAIEYILRSPEKNQLEDLKKARQNLDQLIKHEESKTDHSYADAMKCFADIGKKTVDWTDVFVPNNKVKTHYAGVNPND